MLGGGEVAPRHQRADVVHQGGVEQQMEDHATILLQRLEKPGRLLLGGNALVLVVELQRHFHQG